VSAPLPAIQLVSIINEMHDRACKSARDALESAKACGELPALGGASTVTCAQYWLAEESCELAQQLLGQAAG
jgi:hypothetical protein